MIRKSLKYGLFVLFAVLAGMFSCQDTEIVNCDLCWDIEPEWGDLMIDLTINDENDSVPIVIYRGETITADTEFYGIADTTVYDIEVPLGQHYTVTAEYKVGDKTVIAVDTDEIVSSLSEDYCENGDCYYIAGGRINVKLRHED